MSKSIQQNIIRLEITMHILHFSEIFECFDYFFEVEFSLRGLITHFLLKKSSQISTREIFHRYVEEVLIFEGVSSVNHEVTVNCVQYLFLYAQQIDLVLLHNFVHIHNLERKQIFACILLSQHYIPIRPFAEPLQNCEIFDTDLGRS